MTLHHSKAWAVTVADALLVFVLLAAGGSGFAADEGTKFHFDSKSYELSTVQMDTLEKLVNSAKAEPKLGLVISKPTKSVRKPSIDYITRSNRALRIFQLMARAGVEPARITIREASPQNLAKDDISIEIQRAKVANSITPKLPAPAAGAIGSHEFVINFASASAEPQNLSNDRFKEFLSTVGKPGHDAIVIEGKTDPTGNAAYNMALGELRALVTYERLVRAGLSALRIDTHSLGASKSDGKSGGEASKQAQRSVTVRWTENAEIAQAAAVAEPSPLPVAPSAAHSPPPAKEEVKTVSVETASPPLESDDSRHILDIFAFGGAIIPGGEFQHKAKSGATFGLGISANVLESAASAVRLNLLGGTTRLTDKAAGLNGSLRIKYALLRADYILKLGPVNPYLGVGAGYYLWKGGITKRAIPATNSADHHDGGWLFALGLDVPLTSNLTLEPEVAGQRIVGAFNESIWSLWLALRWSI